MVCRQCFLQKYQKIKRNHAEADKNHQVIVRNLDTLLFLVREKQDSLYVASSQVTLRARMFHPANASSAFPTASAFLRAGILRCRSQNLAILQLNSKGFTLPKLDVLERLISTTKANVVLLQTNKENNTTLKLPGFTLAATLTANATTWRHLRRHQVGAHPPERHQKTPQSSR